jgi:hypothetical protein
MHQLSSWSSMLKRNCLYGGRPLHGLSTLCLGPRTGRASRARLARKRSSLAFFHISTKGSPWITAVETIVIAAAAAAAVRALAVIFTRYHVCRRSVIVGGGVVTVCVASTRDSSFGAVPHSPANRNITKLFRIPLLACGVVSGDRRGCAAIGGDPRMAGGATARRKKKDRSVTLEI